MRITKLRLTGFKSFVEPAELLIEPGLTGVVGPNGCGKSNLLEAMRWAMGEQSPKSLRGGGMEDVIFAGTATRPPRDFAEVAIAAETDEGEQEVVRRVERGAGSAYRLNGRDVRARDIALLFADAATGAHSPALVSQGRIAAVIAARPAERRQMLEEAAGIAGLHVRRREAELKLRATELNLQRLDELLGDMEARTNTLRRQARAAERYRALSAEIRVAEARALFARWRAAVAEAERAAGEARAADAAVAEAGEAQRGAAAQVMHAIARATEAHGASETARDAASQARHAADDLRREQVATERRLRELAAQASSLAADRAREDQLAIDAVEAIARLEAEDQSLGLTLAAATREREGLDAGLIECERAVRDAEVAVAQAHAHAAAEQAELRVAEAALAAARQLVARGQADRAQLDREATALGDGDDLRTAAAAAQAARAAAETGVEQAAAALAAADTAIEQVGQARHAAEEEASRANAALGRIESEAKAIELSLARTEGESLLSGLRVAPGYERALAAALGDDLDAPFGTEGPRGWAGEAARAGDPALGDGLTSLATLVEGGGAIARRLAQVAVADEDDGRMLAVGQRLVTRDGWMRRWDGFVARDAGAAAAERLARVNRLDELRRASPEAAATAEAARVALAAATAAQADARATQEQARRDLSEADDMVRRARFDEDRAAARRQGHAANARLLDERRARLDAEAAEAARALDQAAARRAALPDGHAAQLAASEAATAAERARAALGEVRVRATTLADAITRDTRRREAARAESRGWRTRSGDAARRIDEMDRRAREVAEERDALAARPATLTQGLEEAEEIVAATEAQVADARRVQTEADAALRTAERHAADVGEALAAAREARAGAAARAEHQESRRGEISRLSGDRFACPAAALAERTGFDPATLGEDEAEAARHDGLVADRERLGPVNLVAEAELGELEATRAASSAERDELGEAVNRLRGSIGSLNREGRQRLTAAFEAVDRHFRRLFTTLFAGGEAHLALIDSDDPLEAGLEIMAQPPGKKLGSLTLLSGGEQALTAIALIFALFLTNPAPICVLDEVDAPLDDANIERFCDLLVRMTQETETRYLIVTHNAVTMSRMHRLFGVTMIEQGVSRLVSVDLGGAGSLLAAE